MLLRPFFLHLPQQTYKKLRDDPDYLSTLGQKLESEDLQTEIWTGSDDPLFYTMESNMNNSKNFSRSYSIIVKMKLEEREIS